MNLDDRPRCEAATVPTSPWLPVRPAAARKLQPYLSIETINRTMAMRFTLLVFCLVLVMSGCSKPESTQSATSPQSSTPGAGQTPAIGIDACSLLTSKEIDAIQGAPLKETKRSANSHGGLTVSQCYFLLPTVAESIVVTVTQRADGSNGRDPKQSWGEIFHVDREERKAREEEEREPAAPQEITGIGDEAFWVPRRFGGKLYVLKGNIYITVGVGSPGDQAVKLQKSKTLAESVLKRL